MRCVGSAFNLMSHPLLLTEKYKEIMKQVTYCSECKYDVYCSSALLQNFLLLVSLCSVCRTCSIFRWMVLFLNGALLHTKVTGLLETPTPWDFLTVQKEKDCCYIFGRGFKTGVLHHTVSELHRQLWSRPLDRRQLVTKLRCCRKF